MSLRHSLAALIAGLTLTSPVVAATVNTDDVALLMDVNTLTGSIGATTVQTYRYDGCAPYATNPDVTDCVVLDFYLDPFISDGSPPFEVTFESQSIFEVRYTPTDPDQVSSLYFGGEFQLGYLTQVGPNEFVTTYNRFPISSTIRASVVPLPLPASLLLSGIALLIGGTRKRRASGNP